MLKCENINKFYQEGENQTQVLKGVSFSMEPAELVAIVGSSGSGKSTLLHTLGGLDQPSSGEVFIKGQSLQKASESELAKLRNQNLGFVYQFHHLMADFTALENVMMPMLIGHQNKTEAKDRAEKMLSAVGLSHRMTHRPSALSGGERQRVAIARALATNPKILLCDEATSALDPTTTRSILALLKEINKTLGITIIVITHEMAVIEEICQRVAIIDSSRIAEVGTVDEVFTRPKSAMAKQLIYPDGKRNSLATGKRYCRIVFDGNSSFEPVISNMVLECKAPGNIMFADTKNMDGKAYGQMILQLPEDERAAKRALAYLETQNVHAEEVADYASV